MEQVFKCQHDSEWHNLIIVILGRRNKGVSIPACSGAVTRQRDVWHIENPRCYRTDYHTACLYQPLLWSSGSRTAISIIRPRNREPISRWTSPPPSPLSRSRSPMRLRGRGGGGDEEQSSQRGKGVKGGMQTCCISHFCNYCASVCMLMRVSPPWRSAGGCGSSDRRRLGIVPRLKMFLMPGRSPHLSPS